MTLTYFEDTSTVPSALILVIVFGNVVTCNFESLSFTKNTSGHQISFISLINIVDLSDVRWENDSRGSSQLRRK